MTDLKLLGGAVLMRDEGGVPISGVAARRHPLALLALLAVAPSRSLARGKVVGLLWPDSSETAARTRLNTCVHNVRAALGPEAVVSVGDDLRLGDGTLDCDVWRFESALDAESFRAAVGLYDGPFMDGFRLRGAPSFEKLIERERDRLAAKYRMALETLAEAAEGRDDTEEAVRWWKELAAEDPYSSRVVLRLMDALSAIGDRAAALRIGRAHGTLVREELGVTPDPALREMLDRFASSPERSARDRGPTVAPPTSRRRSGAGEPGPGGPDLRGSAELSRSRLIRAAVAVALVLAAGSLLIGETGDVLGGSPVAAGGERSGPEALEAEDRGEGERRVATAPTAVTPAYELYLQAQRADDMPQDENSVSHVIGLYRRSLELDPEFAEAWAGLADAYVGRAWLSGNAEVWADSGRRAARRAIELDPELADGHAQLGDALWALDEEDAAIPAYRRALELKPGHREAANNLLVLLERRGELAEKAVLLERLHRLDPRSSGPVRDLYHVNVLLRREDAARAWRDSARVRGISLDGVDFRIALFHHGDVERARERLAALDGEGAAGCAACREAAVALYAGEWARARRLYREIYHGEVRGSHIYRSLLDPRLGLAWALDRLERGREAREIAAAVARESEEMLDRGSSPGIQLARLAVARSLLGDTAGSIDALEAAVHTGYRWGTWIENVPTLEPLRDDPRFLTLLARTDSLLTRERPR